MTVRTLIVGTGPEEFCFYRHKLLKTPSRVLRKIYQLTCDRILYRLNASISVSAQFLDKPSFPH